MNDFKKRLITAIILVIAIIVLVKSGVYGFGLLVLAINVGALLEFYRLVGLLNISIKLGLLLSISLLICMLLTLSNLVSPQIFLINLPICFAIYLSQLYSHDPWPFENLAYTFMGITYITLPLFFFIALAFLPTGKIYNSDFVFAIFLMLWVSDTAAYLFGNYVGRKLLFERISPHKTWEGCIGGVGCTIIVGIFLSQYLLIISIIGWIILAIIISITGIYGDLLKSMLKRSVHVKNSGKILPGHGGILDRFDSLLGSAPFAFTYLLLYVHFKI